MADCYVCGCYIPRGKGHRRNVPTGSSVRVYATKRGGASFGYSSGPRTVCLRCAEAIDHSEGDIFIRVLIYIAVWFVSGYIGWQLMTSRGGGFVALLGFLGLLGIPALIVDQVFVKLRQAEFESDRKRANDVPEQWDDAPRNDGSRGTLLERILPPELEYARLRLKGWMSAPDATDTANTFQTGDTILSWADRASADLARKLDQDRDRWRQHLVDMARYVKPRVGEEVLEYNARAGEYFARVGTGLDPRSPASAIRPGEPLATWLERIAPFCLTVEDGESLEDVIPNLVRIGELVPPRSDEAALDWLRRVGNLIDEANAA